MLNYLLRQQTVSIAGHSTADQRIADHGIADHSIAYDSSANYNISTSPFAKLFGVSRAAGLCDEPTPSDPPKYE
jgi:hypothetical protein